MKSFSWLNLAVAIAAMLLLTNSASASYLDASRRAIYSDDFDASASSQAIHLQYSAHRISPAECQLPMPSRDPGRVRVPVDDEFWGSGKGGRHNLDPMPGMIGAILSRVFSGPIVGLSSVFAALR